MSHHYIDGQWIVGDGDVFTSINPLTNETIWQGRMANTSDIHHAIHAAKKARTSWAELSFNERAAYILKFSELIKGIQDELAYHISLETGKPLWEAKTEVNAVIAKATISIEAHQDRLREKQVQQGNDLGHVRYKPLGVAVVLGPFNFPAHLSNGHIIPALLAGNTVILKPSELSPAVAELLLQCWHKTGIPPGVINGLQGDANTAKQLLQQDIQAVFFTGSYQTGLQINRLFSERPEVLLALEMGGNNPLIIEKTDSLPAALYNTVLSTLITAGQRCTCARRLFIKSDDAGDEFLQELIQWYQAVRVGAFTDSPEPFMGTVIRPEHARLHLNAQEKLQSMGGQSLVTMKLLRKNSALLSPGIIDMTKVSNPPDEEIFAPLVQIYRYEHLEQAITLANKTQYGLAAGIFTNNEQHYHLFYQQINAGLIYWNRPTTGALSTLPFGGIGHSGNHRPSAYFAADYCAYPIATLEQNTMTLPQQLLPGIPQ